MTFNRSVTDGGPSRFQRVKDRVVNLYYHPRTLGIPENPVSALLRKSHENALIFDLLEDLFGFYLRPTRVNLTEQLHVALQHNRDHYSGDDGDGYHSSNSSGTGGAHPNGHYETPQMISEGVSRFKKAIGAWSPKRETVKHLNKQATPDPHIWSVEAIRGISVSELNEALANSASELGIDREFVFVPQIYSKNPDARMQNGHGHKNRVWHLERPANHWTQPDIVPNTVFTKNYSGANFLLSRPNLSISASELQKNLYNLGIVNEQGHAQSFRAKGSAKEHHRNSAMAVVSSPKHIPSPNCVNGNTSSNAYYSSGFKVGNPDQHEARSGQVLPDTPELAALRQTVVAQSGFITDVNPTQENEESKKNFAGAGFAAMTERKFRLIRQRYIRILWSGIQLLPGIIWWHQVNKPQKLIMCMLATMGLLSFLNIGLNEGDYFDKEYGAIHFPIATFTYLTNLATFYFGILEIYYFDGNGSLISNIIKVYNAQWDLVLEKIENRKRAEIRHMNLENMNYFNRNSSKQQKKDGISNSPQNSQKGGENGNDSGSGSGTESSATEFYHIGDNDHDTEDESYSLEEASPKTGLAFAKHTHRLPRYRSESHIHGTYVHQDLSCENSIVEALVELNETDGTLRDNLAFENIIDSYGGSPLIKKSRQYEDYFNSSMQGTRQRQRSVSIPGEDQFITDRSQHGSKEALNRHEDDSNYGSSGPSRKQNPQINHPGQSFTSHLVTSRSIREKNLEVLNATRRWNGIIFLILWIVCWVFTAMSIHLAHWSDPGVVRVDDPKFYPFTVPLDPVTKQRCYEPGEELRGEKLKYKEIQEKQHADISKVVSGDLRYSEDAHVYLPDNAHYCSMDDWVVLARDHHCPWIANCVGFWNYKYYITFLIWIYLTAVFGVYITAKAIFLYLCHDMLLANGGILGNGIVGSSVSTGNCSTSAWLNGGMSTTNGLFGTTATRTNDDASNNTSNITENVVEKLKTGTSKKFSSKDTNENDPLSSLRKRKRSPKRKSVNCDYPEARIMLLGTVRYHPETELLDYDYDKLNEDLPQHHIYANDTFITKSNKYKLTCRKVYHWVLSWLFRTRSDFRIFALWISFCWYVFCVGFVYLVGKNQSKMFLQGKILGNRGEVVPESENTYYKNFCRYLGPNPLLWIFPFPGTGSRYEGIYHKDAPHWMDGE